MIFKEYITIKNIIFFALVIIAIKAVSSIRDIALLFFASYVIAASLSPLVDRISQKMKRSFAAVIVLTGAIFATLAFFVPIFVVAAKQLGVFIQELPQNLATINNFIVTKKIYGHRLIEMFSQSNLRDSLSSVASDVFSRSLNITVGAAQVVVVLAVLLMIVFYIIHDKEYLREKFIEFFPDKMKKKANEISDAISLKVGGYVKAQILSMVAVGLMVAVFMAILRIDYSISLGVIAGVLDIIPIIGPTIALTLILFACYDMGWLTIIFAILLFLLAQQLSNNLVRPIVFGKFLDMHPLVILFSLLVAAQFLGVWGVILAPALAATVCVLIDELYLNPINKAK